MLHKFRDFCTIGSGFHIIFHEKDKRCYKNLHFLVASLTESGKSESFLHSFEETTPSSERKPW